MPQRSLFWDVEHLHNSGIAVAFESGQEVKEINAKVAIRESYRQNPASRWTGDPLYITRHLTESLDKTSVVKPFSRMLICGAVLVAVVAQGADPGLQLQHSIADETVIESPADEVLALWDRFKSAFEERAADNFADRFHPLSSLNWNLRLEEGSTEFLQDQTSRASRKALSRSFTHGLREASVDLPLMLWLKERQGLLADFLRNSVADVGEESVAPNELSYHVVERSWLDRLSKSSGLRYGIRPFRTAPYAYAGISIKDGDSLLVLANLRYVFRNFAEHKFELALSLPLTHGLSVDIGAAHQFDRHEAEEHFVLKFFKTLDHGGIFYVGMELREQPAMYAGISFAL